MEVAIRKFSVGQCVYARVKGHPPWPGIITEMKKNKVKVVYFNWRNEFNWLGLKKITPIGLAANVIEANYERNVKFKGAVDEMNLVIGAIINQRKKPSDTRSDFQEKNPVKPIIYLKLLTKSEIDLIVENLKKENKKNKKSGICVSENANDCLKQSDG